LWCSVCVGGPRQRQGHPVCTDQGQVWVHPPVLWGPVEGRGEEWLPVGSGSGHHHEERRLGTFRGRSWATLLTYFIYISRIKVLSQGSFTTFFLCCNFTSSKAGQCFCFTPPTWVPWSTSCVSAPVVTHNVVGAYFAACMRLVHHLGDFKIVYLWPSECHWVGHLLLQLVSLGDAVSLSRHRMQFSTLC